MLEESVRTNTFKHSQCGAVYHIVRVLGGRETLDCLLHARRACLDLVVSDSVLQITGMSFSIGYDPIQRPRNKRTLESRQSSHRSVSRRLDSRRLCTMDFGR